MSRFDEKDTDQKTPTERAEERDHLKRKIRELTERLERRERDSGKSTKQNSGDEPGQNNQD